MQTGRVRNQVEDHREETSLWIWKWVKIQITAWGLDGKRNQPIKDRKREQRPERMMVPLIWIYFVLRFGGRWLPVCLCEQNVTQCGVCQWKQNVAKGFNFLPFCFVLLQEIQLTTTLLPDSPLSCRAKSPARLQFVNRIICKQKCSWIEVLLYL